MKHLILIIVLFFSGFVIAQNAEETLFKLEKAVDLATNSSEKIEAMLALGEYELDHNFKKATQIIPEVYVLVENSSTKIKKEYKALTLVQLGVLKRRLGKHSEALEHYLEALSLFEKNADNKNIADVYHNIGMVFKFQKNHNKSIEYFTKSINVNRGIKNDLGIAQATQMLGSSYSSKKELDSALYFYNKAKTVFESLDDTERLQEVNDNLVSVYRKQKGYDKALELSLYNIDYSKANGKQLALCVNYYSTALIYEGLKEYRMAGKYADSSLKLAKKEGFLHRIASGYKKRSRLWYKLDNYKSAYRDYRRYKTYSDSIFNTETASKIKELELNYAFEKQQQEAKLLTKAERTKKWLYFALFILALIGAFVIALLVKRNYKNRIELAQVMHKTEKQILSQQIKNKEADVKQLIADNTMRLSFKKELLERIKNDINSKDSTILLQNLTTDLRLQIESETKLSGLQDKINLVNKNFTEALKAQFLELTKGEREVVALLRLKLSIKEIMTIRNVSEDSVKSMRRRIRKKMNIPKEQSIEDFIQTIV